MSKEAALRAMREARWAERSAASAPPRVSLAKPVKKTSPAKPAEPAPAADGLCGHRSMNGRTCTREQGHAAKSHRYG
jgi:hypothetical protein